MHKCLNVVVFLFLLIGGTVGAIAQNNLQIAREYLASNDVLNAAPYVLAAVKDDPKNVEVLLLAGDVYNELEKKDSALIFYQQAEKISDKPAIIRKVALALSAVGQHKEAISKINEAVADDKNDVYNYLTLGQVYINADSLQKADIAIRRAQSINSDIADTYVALGDLYYAQKVYELAKMNYDEALTRNSELLEPRIKLALTNYKLANSGVDAETANEYFSASLKAWDEVTQLDTNNAVAFFEKGKILFLSQKYLDAARSLYRYVTLRPDGQLGRWYLAQSFYEVRAYDSAEVQLQKVTLDSVQGKKTSMLARAYVETKNFAKAAQMYATMKTQGTLSSEDMERYGYAAILSGDTVTAVANFKQAIDADPTNCTLMFRVGNLLRQRQDYTGAIDVLRKRLANCNDSLNSTVNYLIGIAFYSAGNVDSAIVALQASIKADSNSLQPYIQLGRAYFEGKNAQAAHDILSKAIEMGKRNSEKSKRDIDQAYALRAANYLDEKDYPALKKMATEWITAFPDSEFGHLYKAIGHQGTNEKDDACREYKQVLKVNPNNKPAKQNMDALGC